MKNFKNVISKLKINSYSLISVKRNKKKFK